MTSDPSQGKPRLKLFNPDQEDIATAPNSKITRELVVGKVTSTLLCGRVSYGKLCDAYNTHMSSQPPVSALPSEEAKETLERDLKSVTEQAVGQVFDSLKDKASGLGTVEWADATAVRVRVIMAQRKPDEPAASVA